MLGPKLATLTLAQAWTLEQARPLLQRSSERQTGAGGKGVRPLHKHLHNQTYPVQLRLGGSAPSIATRLPTTVLWLWANGD